MDYLITEKGIDIIIESRETEPKSRESYQHRDRLMSYYQALLKFKGTQLNSKQYRALNYIVSNMTEAKACEKADDFEKAQYNRLLAYATALTKSQLENTKPEEAKKINQKELEKIDKIAGALVDVLDAATADEQELQETVTINENKFVYTKGSLEIRDYVQQLFDIGERTKGNTWTIYLDAEGDLVIY